MGGGAKNARRRKALRLSGFNNGNMVKKSRGCKQPLEAVPIYESVDLLGVSVVGVSEEGTIP